MLFNLFGKRKEIPDIDFSLLGVDMHSHLIPGIDDGAQTLENSIELIRELSGLGFRKLITTPHVMADMYRNTPETIKNGLDVLRAELIRNGLDMQLDAAAEYYFDEGFEDKIEKGKVLTLGDGFLLFEVSFISFPRSFFEVVEKILINNYKPILAHPERYGYFAKSIEQIERIKKSGCSLQLNILSLTGYYGKSVQKLARELVNRKLIDFIGTDVHHGNHSGMLKKALKNPEVRYLLTEYPLKNKLLL